MNTLILNFKDMEKLKERLSQVDASIIAMQYNVMCLSQEKDLLEGCINNPSPENLSILNNYNKYMGEYIENLLKGMK